MSCPECDHTLEKVVDHVFHCPRCGTMVVKWAGNTRSDTYVPKLVQRCREFEQSGLTSWIATEASRQWKSLGIAESINTPENRRPA